MKLDSIRYKYELSNISNATLIRALKSRGIRFFIAATKEEVSNTLASYRQEFCEERLSKVERELLITRFSDKLHYRYRYSKKRHRILRKIGRIYRYKANCIRRIQGKQIPKNKKDNNNPNKIEEEGKAIYFWYTVGIDFKSKLHFYEVLAKNSKIDTKSYKKLILCNIIKKE